MSIAFSNLESQRTFGGKLVVVLTWMMVLVVVAAKIAVGGSAIGVGVASGLIAAASTAALAAGGRGSMGRSLTGVALMAQVSLLVAAMAGHVWQIDMHMTYFATLALLTIYCDAAVIAAAAATVAVHHLGLSFLLPMAVFPGAANLGRVVVHAFILVVEAATLMGVALSVSAMFESADAARRKAEDAVAEIHAANAAAQAAQRSEELGRIQFSDAQARIEAERAKTVATFAQQLSRLAAGDLTARIEEDFEVDYAQIKIDFNSAARSLEAAMVAIDGAAGGIRRGADEIASASNDLSRRTEHQAASLQETAAALDEVTVTVKNSALGAKDASSLVSSTRADAERAGLVVREAVAAMGQIEQGSSQITQIIGVIDEIAFQTNLLALNAGVEAARAGDAGRGFAVVAQEVRALAQRSATSAKQIKALIATSTDQVKRGVHLVGDTGSALDVIVVKVAEMDQIIATMANSSQEQAHALGQVNLAINEMDQVTQENAAMVEQTTAAAATLRAGAAELDERVARFQTGGRAPPSHLDAGSGRARRSNPVQRLHSRLAASLG